MGERCRQVTIFCFQQMNHKQNRKTKKKNTKPDKERERKNENGRSQKKEFFFEKDEHILTVQCIL